MATVGRAQADESIGAALLAHHELRGWLADRGDELAEAVGLIATSLAEDGRLLVCGNGGSAADAQHIAAEFVGRFLRERQAYSAIALNTNTSALTAIGNDYGFDEVFARQLRAHARRGDVLLAISTSGNSTNVLLAVEAARELGVAVIGLSGGSGGDLAPSCDVCFTVPTNETPRIQEFHLIIGHLICGLAEDALCG